MTLEQRIEQLIVQHGGLAAAARAIQVDCAYLCRLRSGEKANPSVATLRRLGLRRVVGYELLQTPAQRLREKEALMSGIL